MAGRVKEITSRNPVGKKKLHYLFLKTNFILVSITKILVLIGVTGKVPSPGLFLCQVFVSEAKTILHGSYIMTSTVKPAPGLIENFIKPSLI